MIKNVNLKNELVKNRKKQVETEIDHLVCETFGILYDGYIEDKRVAEALEKGEGEQGEFSWAMLDAQRIFSIDEIRKTAIDHRLRFLSTRQFKGEIPYEATLEIKRLEKELDVNLRKFKIMAPSERFRLEDCDKDPLLFLQLSDRYYYFIHQWGDDLKWYRKVLNWPLRSFTTLGVTIAAISFLLALMIPTELLVGGSGSSSVFARMAFFFWCLVSITSMVAYVGFAFFKNLSAYQWNSPFFKQDF